MKIDVVNGDKVYILNKVYENCKEAIASLENIETYLLTGDISEDNTTATITIETTSNFTDEPLHCAKIDVNRDVISMLKELYTKTMKECQKELKELKEMGFDLENSNIPAFFQLLEAPCDEDK